MKTLGKIIFVLIIVGIVESLLYAQENIKKPNVAGQFYPTDPQNLSQEIDKFFVSAVGQPLDKKIKILIVPHAGYVYSGRVAAEGYKAASRNRYSTIVVIGPSHFEDFEGFSVWPQGSFETPLGSLPIDEAFAQQLMAQAKAIKYFPKAFEREHSLEVQLPFLQKTFQNFKIVPIVTGHPNYEDCKKMSLALFNVIKDRDDVLIVVSTDMSHYFSEETALKKDRATLSAITRNEPQQLWQQCVLRNMELCGFPGAVIALLYAQAQGIDHIQLLKYANSGDVTGDKSTVVGYSAIAAYKESEDAMKEEMSGNPGPVEELTLPQKKRLLEIARQTITEYLTTGKILSFPEADPRLLAVEGAFVTLHRAGELRGCIGNIIGRGPLYQTVHDMSIAAATQDPRFNPVNKNELSHIEIEVSVLSVPRVTTNVNEITMGTHGVIVSQGQHSGVFLPQVATETGWGREEFLSNLCAHKAGLPADAWKNPETKIEIFTAQVFSEKDVSSSPE